MRLVTPRHASSRRAGYVPTHVGVIRPGKDKAAICTEVGREYSPHASTMVHVTAFAFSGAEHADCTVVRPGDELAARRGETQVHHSTGVILVHLRRS